MNWNACAAFALSLAASGAFGQGRANEPPPDPAREVTATEIPGVIAGGTTIQFIRAGFNGTEGVIGMPDGSVLFTEQDADKIIRVVSPRGDILGTIPTPIGMQSVGFAGRDTKTLFAVGRGAAYRIPMIAEGLKSRAK